MAFFIENSSGGLRGHKSVMDTIGIYEYNSKDLIGHGAFAVVYKGRVKMVRFIYFLRKKVLATNNRF